MAKKTIMDLYASKLDNNVLRESVEDTLTPDQTEDVEETAMEDEQEAGTEATGFAAVETENKLEAKVKEMILDQAEGDEVKGWLEDLAQNGCVSGMVSGLIYYNETGKFHDEFEDEIWDLADEMSKEMGNKNILEFIGGLNGAEDIGSMDQLKNLLAWFAFEETARKLADKAGLEI